MKVKGYQSIPKKIEVKSVKQNIPNVWISNKINIKNDSKLKNNGSTDVDNKNEIDNVDKSENDKVKPTASCNKAKTSFPFSYRPKGKKMYERGYSSSNQARMAWGRFRFCFVIIY
jgi:hypothetical protein